MLAKICLGVYDGRMWGKCMVCSAYAQKTVWVDRVEHFTTTNHNKAARYDSPEGVPHAAVANAAIVSLPKESTVWSKKRKPNMYYPDGYSNESVYGCFVVDSFAQMVKEDGSWSWYMTRMLTDMWKSTGRVYIAVCAGGSALLAPCGGGMLYSDLLEHVPDGLQDLIVVVSGNDFYKKGRVPLFDAALVPAAEDLATAMKSKAERQLVVLGMSAATWKYEEFMSSDQLQLYDYNAARLRACIEDCGVAATSGCKELECLELGDRIGHVSERSEAIVFNAYPTWACVCSNGPGLVAGADVLSINFDEVLGEGGFGCVYKGVMRESGLACAVKLMCLDADDSDIAKAEVELMQELEHPHILSMYSYYEKESYMYIAMELCETDLYHFMFNFSGVPFEEEAVAVYMRQLLDAVAYLHSLRIVHRDIKSDNIMLQSTSAELPVIKLIDFGLARRCPEGCMLPSSGTVGYMSPEQLQGSCNEACDVWPCGCVMFEFLCGDGTFVPETISWVC